MDTSGRSIWLTSVLVLVMAAGCAPQPPAPASRPAGLLEDDPCAERLHDLAGQLLMFYVQHHKLPRELSQLGPDAPKPLCPVCGDPYVYNPQGLAVPGSSARAILWDALPCHSGVRWGIVMETPSPGHPLKIDVIRLPAEPVPQSP
jgi:hypothetical protein